MMTTIDESILNHFGNEYHGIPLALKALGEQQWLVVLHARPAARLRLSAESDYTKQLDKMGISDETKVGDPHLDDNYVIRAETPEAKEMLANPDVRKALASLDPFLELELTHKEYRLIKDGLQPTPQALETLLEELHNLIKATQAPEGSFE
ncbi:hypothetical protein JST97_09485 [bacterium]|nr:hypothetical protein [bacterium]